MLEPCRAERGKTADGRTVWLRLANKTGIWVSDGGRHFSRTSLQGSRFRFGAVQRPAIRLAAPAAHRDPCRRSANVLQIRAPHPSTATPIGGGGPTPLPVVCTRQNDCQQKKGHTSTSAFRLSTMRMLRVSRRLSPLPPLCRRQLAAVCLRGASVFFCLGLAPSLLCGHCP